MVTGACLADLGNEVILVDTDPAKVATINESRSPIYEPGLDELLSRNCHHIWATSDTQKAVIETDITFIAVGTPSRADGSIDLTYIESACRDIGRAIKEKETFHIVVVKSTVLAGTTEGVIRRTLEEESRKMAHVDFGLVSNPEFLREGSALHDFFESDRIIIGVADERSQVALEDLYASFTCPKLYTAIPVAEMIKYVNNAFLATKISFANEIGNLCKVLGIDTALVFEGVGLDARINSAFFRSGIGFGGSCFPKDLRALKAQAEERGVQPRILKAVIAVNEDQPLRLITLIKKYHPELTGKRIGVLGLAFNPDTDDIRESRAIPIIRELLQESADIIAYDPLAMKAFSRLYPQITYASSAKELLRQTDTILITTEWEEFEMLDYSNKFVIDGRRVKMAEKGSIYEGVCW